VRRELVDNVQPSQLCNKVVCGRRQQNVSRARQHHLSRCSRRAAPPPPKRNCDHVLTNLGRALLVSNLHIKKPAVSVRSTRESVRSRLLNKVSSFCPITVALGLMELRSRRGEVIPEDINGFEQAGCSSSCRGIPKLARERLACSFPGRARPVAS